MQRFLRTVAHSGQPLQANHNPVLAIPLRRDSSTVCRGPSLLQRIAVPPLLGAKQVGQLGDVRCNPARLVWGDNHSPASELGNV